MKKKIKIHLYEEKDRNKRRTDRQIEKKQERPCVWEGERDIRYITTTKRLGHAANRYRLTGRPVYGFMASSRTGVPVDGNGTRVLRQARSPGCCSSSPNRDKTQESFFSLSFFDFSSFLSLVVSSTLSSVIFALSLSLFSSLALCFFLSLFLKTRLQCFVRRLFRWRIAFMKIIVSNLSSSVVNATFEENLRFSLCNCSRIYVSRRSWFAKPHAPREFDGSIISFTVESNFDGDSRCLTRIRQRCSLLLSLSLFHSERGNPSSWSRHHARSRKSNK